MSHRGLLLTDEIPDREGHTVRKRAMDMENLLLRDLAARLLRIHGTIESLLVSDDPHVVSPEFTAETLRAEFDDRLTIFENNIQQQLVNQLKDDINSVVIQFGGALTQYMGDLSTQHVSNTATTNELIVQRMNELSRKLDSMNSTLADVQNRLTTMESELKHLNIAPIFNEFQ